MSFGARLAFFVQKVMCLAFDRTAIPFVGYQDLVDSHHKVAVLTQDRDSFKASVGQHKDETFVITAAQTLCDRSKFL